MFLMPYMELQSTFNLYDFKSAAGTDEQLMGNGQPIGSLAFSVYVCPSDEHPSLGPANRPGATLSPDLLATYKMSNYAASRGANKHISGGSSNCPLWTGWNNLFDASHPGFVTPYPEIGGNPSRWVTFSGPFTRLSYNTKLKEITDGLSNTILMGEVRPLCSKHVAEGWGWSHSGNGILSTVVPLNWDSCSEEPALGCGCWDNWTADLGFKSAHPGGVHFTMGDASVQFLNESLDPFVLNAMGGKADGQVASLP
jgi:hypothetical protein